MIKANQFFPFWSQIMAQQVPANSVKLRYDIEDLQIHIAQVKQRVNNRVVNVKILRLQIMEFLKQILIDDFDFSVINVLCFPWCLVTLLEVFSLSWLWSLEVFSGGFII